MRQAENFKGILDGGVDLVDIFAPQAKKFRNELDLVGIFVPQGDHFDISFRIGVSYTDLVLAYIYFRCGHRAFASVLFV